MDQIRPAPDEDAAETYLHHTFAAVTSPGALAVAAFTLAATAFFVPSGPLSLTMSGTPGQVAARISCIGAGIAVLALAMALWSLLRPEVGPHWPRILGGAAVIVALLAVLEYAIVLVVAAQTKQPPQPLTG
jgi:uncharacterized membrane protein YozB (DUF420 family)